MITKNKITMPIVVFLVIFSFLLTIICSGEETISEKYIVEFKKAFPKVKVTACYEIAKERLLKTVPSKSYDLLMIDPYFSNNESRKHSAKDFEKFYRARLALGLAWANKWDKPFLIVGDSFGSTTKGGKLFSTPDISL